MKAEGAYSYLNHNLTHMRYPREQRVSPEKETAAGSERALENEPGLIRDKIRSELDAALAGTVASAQETIQQEAPGNENLSQFSPDQPMWGWDEVRAFLQQVGRDGRPLEENLFGESLDRQIVKYQEGYGDGELGFAPDIGQIRIPASPAFRERLIRSIESGRVNGVVVVAYPTIEQLRDAARRLSPSVDVTIAIERLLDMRVTEFLIEHFVKRGGVVSDLEDREAVWGQLRWSDQLWRTFKDVSTELNITPSAEWVEDGFSTRDFRNLQKKVFERLPEQEKLRDRLGQVDVVFTNVSQELPPSETSGVCFTELLQWGHDTLSPVEYLAMITAFSEPTRIDTYPAPETWEWTTGVTERFVGWACSLSNGLIIGLEQPDKRNAADSRCRTVIRSAAAVDSE